jgi:hypothetical protein
MKVSSKIRMGLIAVVAGAAAFTAMPANAGAGDQIAIAGTGSIAPGLTQTGGAQTFSFSGNGGGSALGQTGSFSCSVNGNDTIGTTSQGAGGFSGSCNTPCGSVGVSGSYTRTAAVVTASGSLTSGCLAGHSFSGNCAFTPTSGPTVISYAVTCQFQLS